MLDIAILRNKSQGPMEIPTCRINNSMKCRDRAIHCLLEAEGGIGVVAEIAGHTTGQDTQGDDARRSGSHWQSSIPDFGGIRLENTESTNYLRIFIWM